MYVIKDGVVEINLGRGKIFNLNVFRILQGKTFYIIFLVALTLNQSFSLDTKATHAVILDYDTNDIIFEKNSNEKTSPASMTKI